MRFDTLSAWLQWLEQQHPKSIDLGLERVGQVAAQLQLQSPTSDSTQVITVAGTNGKGSFVASLNALLLADGERVGCYTSPHFLSFNERIQVNGEQVSDDLLLQAFAAVDEACDQISLTYFEFTTLAAFWCFNQQSLDYWILEVGLGGRLDAVNIIAPDWGVITSIGLDHQDYLGGTLDMIAQEKCGILRSDTPLICAEQSPPDVLQQAVNTHQSLMIGRDFSFTTDEQQSWILEDRVHQVVYRGLNDNGLSLASQSAAVMLYNQLQNAPTPISEQALRDVFCGLSLPGRFQRFIQDGVDIYLDVAHNPQAAGLLHQRLRQLPVAEEGKRIAIFNMAQDKDIDGVVAQLKEDFTAWFLFDMDNERLSKATDLAARIHAQGINMISVSKNIRQAFARVRSFCQEGDQIVVFGSFFVVAELLPKLSR